MKTQSITTTDLADFGFHEREELIQILRAWHESGLPEDFCQEEVRPMFNKNSGNVFLTNSEFQVAMFNGKSLEMWVTCCNCGNEGYEEDVMIDEENECCAQCKMGDSEVYDDNT